MKIIGSILITVIRVSFANIRGGNMDPAPQRRRGATGRPPLTSPPCVTSSTQDFPHPQVCLPTPKEMKEAPLAMLAPSARGHAMAGGGREAALADVDSASI